MRNRYLVSMIFLLAVSGPIAARPTSPKLEGVDYDKARAIIFSYGWKPFPGDCGGPPVEESDCSNYPELRYCQGVSPGYCQMIFARDNRCLYLTTLEQPPGSGEGNTWIVEVRFSRRKCENPGPA